MVKFDFFGNLQVSESYIFQVQGQAHITLFEVGHNGTKTDNKLWTIIVILNVSKQKTYKRHTLSKTLNSFDCSVVSVPLWEKLLSNE